MRWDSEGGIAFGRRGGQAKRLLIADRQPLVLAALAALLEAHGHHVTAQARSGTQALAAIDAGGIDLALIDIDLADPDPLALLACMRGRCQSLPVIIIAPDSDHAGLSQSFESGIDGLALKSETSESLLLCLGAVAAGGQWFDRTALAQAVERVQAQKDALQLTRRERDVARLVATGQRNRSIAGNLGISEGTVKMHLHNVYAKLGLESRTQLAMDERLRTMS
jgi:two-component system nitrate/nitrite response regulator NarP